MSLTNGDLKNVVYSEITVDAFKPNAGKIEDVIVVAFYLADQNPANDLNTFIQRGFVDNLDSDVSPNTDKDGRYLVFVEMLRNETFPEKFRALLKDVENLTGKMDWKIKTYLSDNKTFSIDDPTLFKYVILDPSQYVTKADFKMKDETESIKEFFKNSALTGLTITDEYVIMTNNNHSIIAEVADVGAYDEVIGRNYLAESAFRLENMPYEAKVLGNMLGNYDVLPIGKFLCIGNGPSVMLLKNTQLKYKEKRFG